MKTVYTCFSTDVIHDGHLNILKHAKEYSLMKEAEAIMEGWKKTA